MQYKRYALIILCVFAIGIVSADVYMQKNPDGSVTFSDDPQKSNQAPINLPPTSSYSVSGTTQKQPETPTIKKSATVPAAETTEEHVNYNSVAIILPKENISPDGASYTFQNTVTITVVVEIKPELQKGDAVQLLLDGVPTSKPGPSLTFSLTREILSRGSHTLEAQVVGANGAVLASSDKVTIYVHYASTQNP